MQDAWYYNQNLKPQGPITRQEMREHILKGSIGPFDLISCGEAGEWRAAREWREFEISLFPAAQEYVPGQDLLTHEKEWVLLVQAPDRDTVLQEGPYSLHELREGLSAQKISQNQYVWKPGLSGWCRIQDRPEFISST